MKEIRNIQRDPKEWSQVFLILALIVVYVYNFKLFPRDRSPLPTIFLEGILSFLNMGLLTFVVSAISIRFVYPSFQLEGRPFWLMLSSPLGMKELYHKKLFLFMPPIMILGLVLNYFSNVYIGTQTLFIYVSFGYVILVSLLSPILSLYLGTKQINFKELPNPYGGMGGVISMFAMMIYAGVTLVPLGWTSFWILYYLQKAGPVPFFLQVRFAIICCTIVAGTLVLARYLMTRTILNLGRIEL